MSKHVLLWPCAVTLLAMVSNHALACGHEHKYWPKGSTICLSHHVLECQETGAWHKMPGTCGVDTPPPGAELTAPGNKAPATEQVKAAPPAPQKPTSN